MEPRNYQRDKRNEFSNRPNLGLLKIIIMGLIIAAGNTKPAFPYDYYYGVKINVNVADKAGTGRKTGTTCFAPGSIPYAALSA